jgi:hypothetical protein
LRVTDTLWRLGPWISYEIVTQRHSGTIMVDSEVGDITGFMGSCREAENSVVG